LVVDGHLMFAEGLARVLSDEPDIHPVGAVADVGDGLELAHELAPDLVLLGVEPGTEDALLQLKTIRTELPEAGVVVLTSMHDPEFAAAALRAGVRGFVSKHRPIDKLVTLIRQAAAGEMVLTEETVPALLRRRPVRDDDVQRAFDRLTPREMETLSVLASGRTTTESAAVLHISPLTVRSHVKQILSKLGVHSKLEAVTLALRHGVIDLDRSA
jgi:DNA-binding NarL/FixJ family response regulator